MKLLIRYIQPNTISCVADYLQRGIMKDLYRLNIQANIILLYTAATITGTLYRELSVIFKDNADGMMFKLAYSISDVRWYLVSRGAIKELNKEVEIIEWQTQ